MSSSERANLQAVLQRAFYFVLKRMSTWNGNVDLTLFVAMMFIAVFNDDAALFQEGIARLATRVPAYFYLESDDPTPKYVLQCSVHYICSLLALGGPRALPEVPCIVRRLTMTSRHSGVKVADWAESQFRGHSWRSSGLGRVPGSRLPLDKFRPPN